MEDVEIRQAVSADKAAVLAIRNNLYGGTDYLEAFYDFYVTSPWCTPYVLVYNNEIVSFTIAVVVDDDNTVISRGGRTMAKCAGKGFYKMLSQHCLETSGAKLLAFLVDNSNTATTTSSFQKENRHILSKPFLRFDANAKSLPLRSVDQKGIERISKLTKPQLEHCIGSATHRPYLFPNNSLIINWMPFKVLPSNIPLLWVHDETSLRLYDVRQENGAMKGLLSFATSYYGTDGMFNVDIDIYGTDKRSLKGHLETHMEFAHNQGDGHSAIVVYCDPCLVSPVVETFGKYGIEQTIWELNLQSLFEKEL